MTTGTPIIEDVELPRPGDLLEGRYRVEALLGAGGMGQVYKAQHEALGKTVAIKALHPEISAVPALVDRFRQEAEALAQIGHPNVAAATDFGTTPGGQLFLVLEYLEGDNLGELLEKEGPMPADRAVFIADQICAALERTHELGIIHRDLKPDNVMLVERGDTRDFVKILDFGVARKVDVQKRAGPDTGRLTHAGVTLGTPGYMAPEQIMALELDGRADLYSVGALLYELLTGKMVFETDDQYELMLAHIETPPPKPSKAPGVVAPIPKALDAIIARLLAKKREDRFQSAAEVRAALANVWRGRAEAEPRGRMVWPVVLAAFLIGGIAALTGVALSGGDEPEGLEEAAGAEAAAAPKPEEKRPRVDKGQPSPPVTPAADPDGLRVLEHAVARNIKSRKPDDEREVYRLEDERVYCYAQLENPGRSREITAVWVRDGEVHHRFEMDIGHSKGWRTWAKLRLRDGLEGVWRCDLVNEDELLLSSRSFTVVN